MHFLPPQLSGVVPLKSGFYAFRAQIGQHHRVDPGTSYTVVPRGLADLYTIRSTRDRSITHSLKI